MTKVFQIHQSGLTLAAVCGIAYEYRYIHGIRLPPKTYQAVGSAVDRSVRGNLGSKILTGALLPVEQAADLARDQAVGILSEFEADHDEIEEHGTVAGVRGAAIDKAVRLSGLHAETLAPEIDAEDVATEFTLTLPGYDFELAGEIDIREKRTYVAPVEPEESAGIWIRDTKTSKKSPRRGEAATSLQLSMYALAEYANTGTLPAAVMLDYLVDLKRGPKIVNQFSARTLADLNPLLERIQRLVETMNTGVFMPCDPGHWKCTAKYCGYFSRCKYAARPATSNPIVTNITPAKPLQDRLAVQRPLEEA